MDLHVRSDPALGRHLVAGRTFTRGEVVLAAAPDVWAAIWPSPLHLSLPSPAELAILQRNPGVQVSRAASGGEPGGEAFAVLAAAWLLAIRALLTRGTPTWARLQTLDDNASLRDPADAAVVSHFAEQLHAALDCDSGGPTLSDCSRLLGAILVNSFGTRSTVSEAAPDGLGLFVCLSLCNHSCDANAFCDFVCARAGEASSPEEYKVSLRASRPIEIGEPVHICYNDSIEPRYVRRRQLLRSKNFSCACSRCEDPTDGERFCSALRCRGCARGWQLEQATSDAWRCAACGCETAAREVEAWDAALRVRLGVAGEVEGGEEACRVYAQIIDAALERCHPNHAIVIQALVAAVGARSRSRPLDAASTLRTVAAAEAALRALERTAHFDPQKADVQFQAGTAQAHASLLCAPAEAGARRTALLQAAASFQKALAQFRACHGDGSSPGR
eukprot:CAMPEP_0180111656 /NCGR_PEP_ID=MMETSP0985-20121206/35756_1 /TAXON_ID=483367 /ORGANISM="non described non described, Strain CCMP 2436" /LENGTH=445 /DNA_ID=CAMNT_0022049889 /DNA_START=43 /DNA_END=1377 /DNA_ORIENTATION=-